MKYKEKNIIKSKIHIYLYSIIVKKLLYLYKMLSSTSTTSQYSVLRQNVKERYVLIAAKLQLRSESEYN